MQAASPPANIYEGNGEISVAIPIPGAHPVNTELLVTPRQLQVEADCKYPQESQHYHRHDWQVGSWRATIDLPKAVDPARAKATLNLGVLVFMAPVAEGADGQQRLRPS